MTADSSRWCESIVSSAILEGRRQCRQLGFRYKAHPAPRNEAYQCFKKWDKGSKKTDQARPRKRNCGRENEPVAEACRSCLIDTGV